MKIVVKGINEWKQGFMPGAYVSCWGRVGNIMIITIIIVIAIIDC